MRCSRRNPSSRRGLGKAELLRKLPSHRRNRTARTRHSALRADEARWTSEDPRTGRIPYAAVQLRQEKSARRLLQPCRIPESSEIRRAGARAEPDSRTRKCARFLRYGKIHRNTYINSPTLLNPTLQMKAHPHVLFAGQICGVEGYVESIATGLLAGVNAVLRWRPVTSLCLRRERRRLDRSSTSITQAESKNFQPANITFDLLPALDRKIPRSGKRRHQLQCELAFGGSSTHGTTRVRRQTADPSLRSG